jgi:hypothetical protein
MLMKSTIFSDITSCSPLSVNRRFGGTYRLHFWGRWNKLSFPPAFTLVSCWPYFSTMNMEAICSSETSVYTQRTTRRYIPEDGTLHNLFMLAACSVLVSFLAYFVTLKMEVLRSCETSVDFFYWTTRRYVLEERRLHSHQIRHKCSYVSISLFKGTEASKKSG